MNIDKLIEQASPVTDPIKFDLGFGEDCVIWFQLPGTFTEWNKFKKERADWAQRHSMLKVPPDPAWADVWTQDKESLERVYLMSTLSVDPGRLSVFDALKLLNAPALVEGIERHLELHRCRGIAEAFNLLESEAKNDSSGTPDTDSGSPSAETSTGDTPTN